MNSISSMKDLDHISGNNNMFMSTKVGGSFWSRPLALLINNFLQNDVLCSIPNIIDSLHPFHLI